MLPAPMGEVKPCPIVTDPQGCYTGRPLELYEQPVQDADDLWSVSKSDNEAMIPGCPGISPIRPCISAGLPYRPDYVARFCWRQAPAGPVGIVPDYISAAFAADPYVPWIWIFQSGLRLLGQWRRSQPCTQPVGRLSPRWCPALFSLPCCVVPSTAYAPEGRKMLKSLWKIHNKATGHSSCLHI